MAEESNDTAAASLLRAGEDVLLVDRKDREYLRTLIAGKTIHLRSGTFVMDDIIGLPEGSVVCNSGGEPFLILRPTYASLIPHLPRQAQVIYPKDVGLILLWGDIYPGARVLEVGTGPGALTMALLRAVGPTGHLYSYELREDFAAMARANVERFYGPAPQWTLKLADIRDGIAEGHLDRIVIDLPEPWRLLAEAWRALRPGAVLVAYVPTVLQMKHFVDSARLSGFTAVEAMENLLRGWHIEGQSVRPDHRMVAHTGFVITARRLAALPAARDAPGEERGDAGGGEAGEPAADAESDED
jgi:tRNA (adenine57-N1/adenine58-N1)-methyltransferase catalytic subunit